MKFNTDGHFLLGYSHHTAGKPCQDFALSGVYGDMALAIVSDGCSTADRDFANKTIPGVYSDMGSRVVAFATRAAIREMWSTTRQVKDTILERITVRQHILMDAARGTLGLVRNDLFATCVFAMITPQGGFISIQGDGVVALRYRNGDIALHHFNWFHAEPEKANAPAYPAYADENYAGFINHYGGLQTPALKEVVWIKKPNEEVKIHVEETYTVAEGIGGITLELSAKEVEDLDFIAVFTDGVSQIEGVETSEAVVELLSFKTTEGEFAKRRINRVVRDAQKNGHGPVDDIAYAVIHIDHKKAEEVT